MNYKEINRRSWNRRTEYHVKSAFYDVSGFLAGNTSLNEIELGLLGDIKGKSILHLQCHFGQDSVSLARMGAEVTGVDLSDKAIDEAKLLAEKAGVKVDFVCCDIYDLPQHLNKRFDLVYTSYGVIGWLPDMDRWAEIISGFLKSGGKFLLIEFHPVVWMFDDNFERIAYNYFNSGAIVETEAGTYAEKEAPIKEEYVMWNHGTSEVLNSLLKNGLQILSFNEYDYSPYNCFKHTVEIENRKYRINHLDNKIPMVFSVEAGKNEIGRKGR